MWFGCHRVTFCRHRTCFGWLIGWWPSSGPSSHEIQNSIFVWPSVVNFGTVCRQQYGYHFTEKLRTGQRNVLNTGVGLYVRSDCDLAYGSTSMLMEYTIALTVLSSTSSQSLLTDTSVNAHLHNRLPKYPENHKMPSDRKSSIFSSLVRISAI